MPKKTYKKKSYKKKSWRRKPYGIYADKEQRLIVNKRNSIFAGRGTGFGRQLETKLRTVFYHNTTSDSAGIYAGYYDVGSAHSPGGDQVAIQPVLYDQLSAMYARYVVKSASVKITLAHSGWDPTATSYFINLTAYPSTVTTAKTTFQAAASQPWAQSVVVAAHGEPKTMSWFLDNAAVIGRTGPVTAEDNGALVTAAPTTGQAMVLCFFLQHAIAATMSATFQVEIIQDVIFDQRIQVVDS